MSSGHVLRWDCDGRSVALVGAKDAPGQRERLLNQLLDALPGTPRSCRLRHDLAGRPVASIRERGGDVALGVSFSRHGGWLWAALSRSASLGLDACGADGFAGPYPDERVFSPLELTMARSLTPDPASARALLWSVKEAAVKSLGTGFNALEPKEVAVGGMATEAQGTLRFRVATRLGELSVRCGTHFAFQLAVALPAQAAGRANG